MSSKSVNKIESHRFCWNFSRTRLTLSANSSPHSFKLKQIILFCNFGGRFSQIISTRLCFEIWTGTRLKFLQRLNNFLPSSKFLKNQFKDTYFKKITNSKQLRIKSNSRIGLHILDNPIRRSDCIRSSFLHQRPSRFQLLLRLKYSKNTIGCKL